MRPFKPATEPRDLNPTDKTRANHIVDRVLGTRCRDGRAASWPKCSRISKAATATCSTTFEARAAEMEEAFEPHADLQQGAAQLVGAYFLHEYSFEASALFNPSIVAASRPDRRAGRRLRFILSLRAVGEGHVSSLTFRSGTIAADGSVTVDPTARLARRAADRRTGRQARTATMSR